MRLGSLGPVTVGVAVVVVAFFAASYIGGSSEPSDPAKEIVAQLEDAVRADPQDATARIVVAEAYLKADRPEDARVQFEEALRIDPDREDAMYGLAMAYKALGQNDLAAGGFEAIIEANRDNPAAQLNRQLQGSHFYLGQILRDAGLYDDAINEFRAALTLNRADADTLFELGKTFALAGNTADAIAAFDVTLSYVPDYREAYVELGSTATAVGDQARAEFARAMLLVLDGDAKEAVPLLQALAEQNESARFWWGLGYASELAGDTTGAAEAYRKSVDINPGELLAAESLRRLDGGGEP
jgi:tetratricopeptide (TPR) repeat protein